jgi:hypothetical protein
MKLWKKVALVAVILLAPATAWTTYRLTTGCGCENGGGCKCGPKCNCQHHVRGT